MSINKIAFLPYLIIAAIHLFCVTNNFGQTDELSRLQFISKAMLIPALCFGLYKNVGFSQVIFLALFFSFLGDLLLIKGSTFIFFILGLLSFLIAHLFYIKLFHKSWDTGFFKDNKSPIVFVSLIMLSNFSVLLPGMDIGLMIPIVVYALVLGLMVLTMINLKGIIENTAWNYLFAGALLFMLSDNLIALNKFTDLFKEMNSITFLIMLTYILAQLSIVLGFIESKK